MEVVSLMLVVELVVRHGISRQRMRAMLPGSQLADSK